MTYLVVIYFSTYVPIYETYFLQNWFPRWNHILTQLRFIHNWVITNIQWMVRWWVLVHCGYFLPVFLENQLELWILWETLQWILFYSLKIYWNLELGFFDFENSQTKPEVMTKSKNCATQVITSIAQLWFHDRFWF